MEAKIWLDTYYPKAQRKHVKTLTISKKNGDLDLAGFTNLRELHLSNTSLSSVKLDSCRTLTHLIISDDALKSLNLMENSLLEHIDLSLPKADFKFDEFADLFNLRYLSLAGSDGIKGMITSLTNSPNLWYLNISKNKEIIGDVGDIPNLKNYLKPEKKLRDIFFDLPIMERIPGTFVCDGTGFETELKDHDYDLNIWKHDNP